uniref:PilZ domain-containing protein n=1 Tax=Astatotilapia calliptera TaxID=8154 RepID=A0AAX7TCH6_ASTCA
MSPRTLKRRQSWILRCGSHNLHGMLVTVLIQTICKTNKYHSGKPLLFKKTQDLCNNVLWTDKISVEMSRHNARNISTNSSYQLSGTMMDISGFGLILQSQDLGTQIPDLYLTEMPGKDLNRAVQK